MAGRGKIVITYKNRCMRIIDANLIKQIDLINENHEIIEVKMFDNDCFRPIKENDDSIENIVYKVNGKERLYTTSSKDLVQLAEDISDEW